VELFVADDGRGLIELLGTGIKPFAIFLDLNMPLKSGLECLWEIRKSSRLNDTRVLILSTSTRQTDINYGLKHGANAYFVKPNTIEELGLNK